MAREQGARPALSLAAGRRLHTPRRARGSPVLPPQARVRVRVRARVRAQPSGAPRTAKPPTALQPFPRRCLPRAPGLPAPLAPCARGGFPSGAPVRSRGPARSRRLRPPLPRRPPLGSPGGGVSLRARPRPPPTLPSPARPYVCVTTRHARPPARPPTSQPLQRGLAELRTRAAPLKVSLSLRALTGRHLTRVPGAPGTLQWPFPRPAGTPQPSRCRRGRRLRGPADRTPAGGGVRSARAERLPRCAARPGPPGPRSPRPPPQVCGTEVLAEGSPTLQGNCLLPSRERLSRRGGGDPRSASSGATAAALRAGGCAASVSPVGGKLVLGVPDGCVRRGVEQTFRLLKTQREWGKETRDEGLLSAGPPKLRKREQGAFTPDSRVFSSPGVWNEPWWTD